MFLLFAGFVLKHKTSSGVLPVNLHTQVLTRLLAVEAVVVTAAAAVPEARALALLRVVEPDHGVVLAAAGVLAQETGFWKDTGQISRRLVDPLKFERLDIFILLNDLLNHLSAASDSQSHPDVIWVMEAWRTPEGVLFVM